MLPSSWPRLPAYPCLQTHSPSRPLVGSPESVFIVADPATERASGTDGDDVESAARDSLSLYDKKIARRIQKMCQLYIGYGYNRVHEGSRLTCSDLHKDKDPPFLSDDIDLSGRTKVVALKDAVAPQEEEKSRGALTFESGAEVWRFAFEEHGGVDARKGPGCSWSVGGWSVGANKRDDPT